MTENRAVTGLPSKPLVEVGVDGAQENAKTLSAGAVSGKKVPASIGKQGKKIVQSSDKVDGAVGQKAAVKPVSKAVADRGAKPSTKPIPAAPAEKTGAKTTGGTAATAMRKRAETAEARVKSLENQLQDKYLQTMASPARMKRRHWGVLASFVALVLAPLAAAVFYLFAFAGDQYLSTTGFIVRSQDSTGANEFLGGLAQFAGTSTASDSDILFEFVRSQEIVEDVEAETNMKAHYAAHWPQDWVFALWPSATLEELSWYWRRIVRVSYDAGSGLMEVRVSAYDPDMAQAITTAIVNLSQTRINELNEQARADAMRYAQADLNDALERLKEAREALIQFRTRTRIVDPETDIRGRMGVMNNLQQQLAEALIELDLLRGSLGNNDPRITLAQKRIDVIRSRINLERNSCASADVTENGGIGVDYPSLISEYERLSVDREFAEEAYRAALTALEVARDEATRQSRYLATYIRPTLAETSEYPRRFVLSALAGLFLLLSWAIVVLVYYSIRDRR